MKFFRRTTLVSTSLLVAGCAAAAACSSDNGSSNGNDGGSGGSVSESGGSSGKAGSGGASSGGASSGGSSGTGTGGLGTTNDGGVIPRDSGTDATGADGGDAGAMAMFRVVHAAPGAGAVDIYVSGTSKAVATNIAYGGSTPYLSLAAGTYTFDLRKAGDAATATPLFTTPSIDVSAGARYTAVAEGNIASTAAADRFRVAALPETFTPAGAGKARIRVVHANYDGPAVDLDIGNDDAANPDFKGLKPFTDTGAAGIEVDADTNVQVGVVVGGVTLTAFTTPKLDAGSDVFVIATGLASKLAREPTGLAALAVLPDSSTTLIRQNPRVYALHASPDAGPVDAFLGPIEAIDNASFNDFKILQVPPGMYTLDLFAGVAGATTRPAGAPVASVTTPMLEAGNSYLSVLAGTVTTATKTLKLTTLAEGFDLTKSAQALVRVVHGSSDAPKVDVGLVTTPGTLVTPAPFTGLSFGDASDPVGVSVPIGAETLGAAATGTTTTMAEFAVTTAAAQRSFAVVAGSAAGGAHPLELVVVDTTGAFWAPHVIAKN